MFRPKGIGVDSEGHLYVVEGSMNMVQVFDREGQFLYSSASRGQGSATSVCLLVCLSIIATACSSWIPTTIACRYFGFSP